MTFNLSKRFFFNRPLVVVLMVCFNLYGTMPELLLAQEAPQQADRGYLNIVTKRSGLEVRIDGELAGFTPLGLQELPAGLHEIHVVHPDRLIWLDQDWVEEVEVPANDTVDVDVSFMRSFSINSKPYGAAASLDGALVGETPVFFKLDGGEIGQVTLSKPNYRDTTFVVGNSDVSFFDVVLQSTNLDIQMKIQAAAQKQRSTNKSRFLTSVGVSVVSGAVALYFREKADGRYDRYLETGNPEKFEALYDDAKKFDKFAAVSFGVFQVSVVFSFFSFLKFVDQ